MLSFFSKTCLYLQPRKQKKGAVAQSAVVFQHDVGVLEKQGPEERSESG